MKKIWDAIILTTVSEDESEKIKEALKEKAPRKEFQFKILTENELNLTTEEALEKARSEKEEKTASSLYSPFPIFFISVVKKQEGLKLVSKIKNLNPLYKDAAFALITNTAKKWSIEHYIKEISLEHKNLSSHGRKN